MFERLCPSSNASLIGGEIFSMITKRRPVAAIRRAIATDLSRAPCGRGIYLTAIADRYLPGTTSASCSRGGCAPVTYAREKLF